MTANPIIAAADLEPGMQVRTVYGWQEVIQAERFPQDVQVTYSMGTGEHRTVRIWHTARCEIMHPEQTTKENDEQLDLDRQ